MSDFIDLSTRFLIRRLKTKGKTSNWGMEMNKLLISNESMVTWLTSSKEETFLLSSMLFLTVFEVSQIVSK